MRLIDADALHKDLLDSYELLRRMYDKAEDEQTIKKVTSILVCLVECTMRIKDAPTIDTTPVVHARWVPRGSAYYDAGMFYCSACKDERFFGYEVSTSEEAEKYAHFCPECGAKMDAKEENE